MFGEAESLSTAGRCVGVASVAGASVLFAWLQARGLVLRAREGSSRWASNLRDALNLAAIVLLTVAFVLCGAPKAAAFLFAASIGVLLEVVRHFGADPAIRLRRVLLVGTAVALPFALWTPAAVDALNEAARALF